MTLTFRSTTSEMVQIVIRDSDGSRRVATLERDPNNSRNWTGSVDHPSGQKYAVQSFGPDCVDALDKLSHAFVSREVDYRQSKGRGHRPPPPDRDTSQRVDEFGDNLAAPIIPRR